MIYFKSDYTQGAHPQILKALVETNSEHTGTHTLDVYSDRAAELIKEIIGRPDAEVHMMVGGTPTNVCTIAAALRPYEAVVAPRSAHIYAHECGAVEKAGHKIIPMDPVDGKITPELIDKAWIEYEDDHTVLPRLLSISQTTELGSLYSLDELKALRAKCDEKDMLLYIDGARLGVALTAPDADFTIKDIAEIADAFYIGGTKHGLLLGEAVVLLNDAFKPYYRWIIKQNNAMLAKGRILGVQFIELLKGGDESLFYSIGHHMNAAAVKIHKIFETAGYEFFSSSLTNQIFPILPKGLIAHLQKDFDFYEWAPLENKDDVMVTRFVTGFGTTSDDIESLAKAVFDFQNGNVK